MITDKTCKIIIIDDHALIRIGLGKLISENTAFEIIGEFEEVRHLLNANTCLTPDLVLLDLKLKGMNGIRACPLLKKKFNCKIIAVTQYEQDEINLDKNEFDGYVNKEDNELLFEAIDKVIGGGKYFVEKAKTQLIGASDFSETDSFKKSTGITTREIEVINLVIKGFTNKQISSKLFIAVDTVKNHRKNFYEKSCVRKLPDLIQYMEKHGLTTG